MDHFDRFFATIERKPVDRPASWLGLPLPSAEKRLLDFFKAQSIDEVKRVVDDDLYPVEIPYHSPYSDAIYAAFNFASRDRCSLEQRTLTTPGFFENYSDPDRVDEFEWPEPAKHIDPEECRNVVNRVPSGIPSLGIVWSAHFQDACAAFGMETALIKMLTEPAMFQAVIDRITQFYLQANEIFYSATKGRLHAVLIGNDFGSQRGLILSRQAIQKFAFPGTRKLTEQAKSYGLKVFHHSCGSIFEIMPDLIELGVDVIHPVQALARNMDPERLRNHFGDQISFCGGVDTQYLMVHGNPDSIRQRVRELKAIFPTGLIISPSHEAILPDVNPANVAALFEAVNEIER